MLMKYPPKLFLILIYLVVFDLGAQTNDNVILKAMHDELKRSMDMRDTGHDKPFFISYGINDLTNFSVYASLGAIIQSGESRNRSKSVRVLVGDYEFNDESLDNNTFSEGTAREIQLPSDDDYYGIRRALWTTTDAVYRGAAQKYRKHQNTLKEQQKTVTDLPHRTFARVPLVKKADFHIPVTLDKAVLEDYCRKVSAVFKRYPGMESSDVMISITTGDDYFVNSEGTSVVKPYQFAVLQCRAQLKTTMGEPIDESLVHYARSPEEFPKVENMIAEATTMAEKLIKTAKAQPLEDEYTGPVLFIGSAVADLFSSALFSFKESLVASNAIMSANDFRPEATGLLDSRIGKNIIDNSITIKAKTKLKKSENEILIGSYEVDDEGVVPPDEMVLVEKGVLKDLLNDRSLTRHGQTSNGHSSGAGVLEITSAKQSSEKELKATLIETAVKDGLDFAIIVRSSGGMRANMLEIWRVDLETGAEELLRPAHLPALSLKDLRRIAGASSVQHISNVSAGEAVLTSFICPSALLLETVDIAPLKLPYLEEDIVYVPSPLKP